MHPVQILTLPRIQCNYYMNDTPKSRHYGEAPDTTWGPEDDLNSTRVMRDTLQLENPDFVVFTGDLVTGEVMFSNATEYIHLLLKPVVEQGYK